MGSESGSVVGLLCPRCGGPLPAAAAAQAVTCTFCGTTVVRAGDEADAPPGDEATLARRRERDARLVELVKASGPISERALVELVTQTEIDAVQAPVVARITLALLSAAGGPHGASLLGDPIAVSRVLEAWLAALPAIAAHGEARIQLQFLGSTPAGPVHLDRTLAAADVRRLAAAPTVPRRGCSPFR